jgi:transglutaminase-like putative cysteine protease
MYWLTRRIRRPLAAMLAAMMALSSAAPAVRTAAAAAADEQPWTAEQWHQALAVTERLRDVARDELNKPGACPWDVEAKAAQLGYDVEKTFAFVRDEVRFEPYAGVLRGARGALSGRAGNARDKSLLLAALLTAGGHPARVVTGTLPPDAAKKLVEAYLAADPLGGPMAEFTATAAPAANRDAEMKAFSDRTGLDPAALAESDAAEAKLSRELFDRAWTQSESHFKSLSAWLQGGGVKLGRSPQEWANELTQRAGDHAWVQVANPAGGADAWIDLDATVPGSTRGQRHAADPKPLDLAKDRHLVTLRVDYRRTENGKPTAVPIVQVDVPADEALYDAASLSVYPVDPGLPSIDKMATLTPEQHRDVMLKLKNFQAAVRVGGKVFSSRPFDLKGNILEASSDGRVKNASQIGSAVGGMFGGLTGGGDEKPADDAGAFVDLAITFTFKSPGKPPRSQSRVLYSAADLKAARIKRPLFEWQILIQPQPISSDAAAYALAKYTLDLYGPYLDLMKSAVSGAKVQAVAADAERIAKSVPASYPTSLVQFAQFRQQAIARLLGEGNGALALLWDAPQAYVLDRHVCMGREKGDLCSHLRIDIVDNAVAFVPKGSASAGASAAAALRLGAFETVAEAEVIRQLAPASAVRSPLDTFATVVSSGGKAVTFTAGADAPADAQLIDADRAWVRQNEPADRVVVAIAGKAASAADSVWWSVDPATGSAVGRASGGGGQAQTEYSTIVSNYLQHVACWAGVFGEMLAGVKEVQKGNVISMDQGKRAFLLGKGFIECVMGLTKVDWAKPTSWKAAYESAKKMKSALGGLADAIYALS